MARPTLLLWMLLLLALGCVCAEEYHRHTNNWAVIVDTSRFWSNYRHVANALSLYHSVKRLGIPDSQIILMLADQMPCNARNCFPGQIFNSRTQKINLYGKNVEVDYRGSEVSVANFITVLTGRHEPGTPASKKLDTDENSNIFLYMSGHGGDGFLKFQDFEEMSSQDLADSIQEMHVKKRYNEIFFMVDTCQAGSLSNALESPKVVTIGSSQTGENSYAHHSDFELGLSVIDRFTFSTLDYLQRMKVGDSIRNGTLRDLFNFYDPKMLISTPDYRTDILGRSIDEVPITDFLGSMLDVHLHSDDEAYPIEASPVSVAPSPKASAVDEATDVLDMSSQRGGSNSSPTCVQCFQFTKEFLVGAAAAIIGAVFVTSKGV
ncbi:GPI-anchor transamidase [Phytophthora rubi]|uniref:GPI-anchor transamidase n=1 Tax=Phytophthora rubi TaxID=129364 RepID=A0A6A3MDC4_9STRA|nr:GPI-anchor transamidase [Phytophthora fragariae]KAE9026193.1 GPI-anchor transamidase [Phytophthora rubi]KAE9031213.1 GPI-anchor transamidase [Phytophthora rubi]KAE9338462.1 GPI-anchor transamidase [Phytophthora rubi]